MYKLAIQPSLPTSLCYTLVELFQLDLVMRLPCNTYFPGALNFVLLGLFGILPPPSSGAAPAVAGVGA